MKLSKYYMPTLREVPSDAEIASHQLLLRAGMIRKSATGIYTYLPLGYRVIKKIEAIVREEMDRAGSMEILMSALQPKEIWEQSGRWAVYGPEMFKLKDRNQREFCLGPTAEEYFTSLVKDEVRSYKQLPLNIYQIQTKYRDEKRPRFGLNRAREFSMKDAYSFDTDAQSMVEAYMVMYKAYERIFDRLGLDYRIVLGDSGAMGGSSSHEFIALSETGEGVICFTKDGKIAYTDEKAPVHYQGPQEEEAKDLEKVPTPGASTIEEVAKFLKLDPKRCAKAVDLLIDGEACIVFIPGDRELNLTKLAAYTQVPEHAIEKMDDQAILACGSYPGFTGPMDLKDTRVILDQSLTKINNLVVGGNQEGYHYINACYGRDFDGEVAPDLLMVQEGDLAEDGQELLFRRGIEVGNIFQLGTKYSTALNATYLDENGKEQYFYMGSYGVGITRSVTAIVEQNHDDAGIIWPLHLAPYQVIVTIVQSKDQDQVALGEKIYQDLQDKGLDVLLDDRNERPGVKFNDRDLIGIPLRITVGKKASQGVVEYSTRKDMVNQDLSVDQAMEEVLKACEEIK